ncbi:MAG TPA: DUF4175 family protein [Alphaproteobacteria bacterium]|jgi:uncharacterized protein (TIGR02302 family)|nr:DUF4175 family protein [Alphaproteobacteria bacterium]
MRLGPSRLDNRIAWYAGLARIVLWLESAAASFWPAATLVGFFVILAVFGIPTALPAWLHLIFLIAYLAVLGLAIRHGLRQFSAASYGAAERKVERDSALRHRPFETLVDCPAGVDGDETAAMLWRLHQERKRAEIGRLRVGLPQPNLPARDPWALRLLVAIVLVLGIAIAGPRTGRLVMAALTPEFGSATAAIPVEAWVKPPAYTGLAPILLKNDSEARVPVPTGSTLEVHVTGGSSTPRLTLGDAKDDFKHIEGGGFAITRTLTTAGDLSVHRGWFSTLAQWQIDIIPDQLPVVAFTAPPAVMQSSAIKFDYHATDDYGVAEIQLKARRVPGQPDVVAEPIDITLASGQTEKELRGSSYQDLTAHPWAGMQVLVKLVATDVAGQTGESQEAVFRLPERRFVNDVAMEIAAIRKHVIFDDEPRFKLALELFNITGHPDVFGEDLSVFLALKAAATELRRAARHDNDATLDIEDLLWNAALKIEDGNRPQAEKDLRTAEEALEKALKDPNASPSEIARLTQNLKDAMNRDLQAMAENLQKQMQAGQKQDDADPNSQTIDQHELNDQVDKMNQMAQAGSRDAAQDMLDYIKQLLENMKTGAGKPNEQGKKSLQDLKDMAKKQRDMESGSEPNSAEKQEALRKALGESARQIGESMGNIPQAMGEADKAMRNATKALQRGTKGGAQGDQEDAAGKLDEAAQDLSDQLSQQQGNETIMKGDGEGNKDPLGRSRFDTGRTVHVPTDREMQRSRAILDELRKRAGEHERPRQELDYLQRLLQQY